MIGRIRLPFGTPVEATLNSELMWESESLRIADWLNRYYPPTQDYSPADGAPGYKRFEEIAKELGAEILEISEPPDIDPDVLY